MKKLILLSLILIGCSKKETKPNTTNQTQSSQTTGTVYCWYQVFNGNQTLYKCTSSQTEYNETSSYCALNGMNMVVKQKNNCNECQ